MSADAPPAAPAFVVWEDDAGERPLAVYFAASHAQAIAAVVALKCELAAFNAAGGVMKGYERTMDYFYSDASGALYLVTDAGEARPVRHGDRHDRKRFPVDADSDYHRRRGVLCVDIKSCLGVPTCEQDTGALAWYVTQGYAGGKKMKRRFWNAIGALPEHTIATLRAIYATNREYERVPAPHEPVPCANADAGEDCECPDFDEE